MVELEWEYSAKMEACQLTNPFEYAIRCRHWKQFQFDRQQAIQSLPSSTSGQTEAHLPVFASGTSSQQQPPCQPPNELVSLSSTEQRGWEPLLDAVGDQLRSSIDATSALHSNSPSRIARLTRFYILCFVQKWVGGATYSYRALVWNTRARAAIASRADIRGAEQRQSGFRQWVSKPVRCAADAGAGTGYWSLWLIRFSLPCLLR